MAKTAKGIDCNMRRATESYNLQVINPKLSEQWHPTKNGNLSPKDVPPGSRKKVWWRCEKGHSWQAIIYSRSNGRGCPYCAGRFATDDNNLGKLRPDIAKQWHPNKNNPLKPTDVKIFSHKKVWWRCEQGHEWQTTVQHRTHGTRCPYCTGRKASSAYNLEVLYQNLAAEWNHDKNESLTPDTVTPGSRKKVWWKCSNGHEWYAAIFSRTAGCGCPYCFR
jgi:hypothetical protein